MYRARVEAVSGVRVRAGGKWLTCIGNKNVRVGDLIWTDGRCVYGHEQTPQQPHVITSDEDLAIPILSKDKAYTCLKSAKFKNEIDFEIFKSTSSGYLSNNKIGKTKIARAENTMALNVDGSGNIYRITINVETPEEFVRYKTIKVRKNDTVIYSKRLKNTLNCSAFIEDENNWYFIMWEAFYEGRERDPIAHHYGTYDDDEYDYIIDDIPDVLNALFRVTLYKQGKETILIDSKGTISYEDYFESDFQWTLDNKTVGLQLPMHDGFYLKFSKCEYKGNYTWAGWNAFDFEYEVYSDDKLVFRDKAEGFIPYVCACKLGGGNFLCCVKRPMTANKATLYLVKEQKLSELLDGHFYNQCLRPMKRYKGWYEKIESID